MVGHVIQSVQDEILKRTAFLPTFKTEQAYSDDEPKAA